jgi:hypothetical protein
MQQNGVRDDQVSQVRGYADQRLRNPKDALDPSNRRISLIVHYIETKPDAPDSVPDTTLVPHAAGEVKSTSTK